MSRRYPPQIIIASLWPRHRFNRGRIRRINRSRHNKTANQNRQAFSWLDRDGAQAELKNHQHTNDSGCEIIGNTLIYTNVRILRLSAQIIASNARVRALTRLLVSLATKDSRRFSSVRLIFDLSLLLKSSSGSNNPIERGWGGRRWWRYCEMPTTRAPTTINNQQNSAVHKLLRSHLSHEQINTSRNTWDDIYAKGRRKIEEEETESSKMRIL